MAFTLVELLVTIAITAILTAIAVPAISSVVQANGVTRAGYLLNDVIIQARQFASTTGYSVQVALYKPDGSTYTAVQVIGGPGLTNALTKPVLLPDTFSLNTSMSPLIAAISGNIILSGTTPIAGKQNVAGNYFMIRPSGAVEPTLTAANNYLTVGSSNLATPLNYVTIQIDPDFAWTSVYRP